METPATTVQNHPSARPKLMAAVLCAFLGMGALANLVWPDRSFSNTENRVLAQRPVFSTKELFNGRYTRDVERWLTDQFPLRDGWVWLKAFAERISGRQEIKSVYLARDGYLMGSYADPDMDLVRQNAEYVAEFAARCPVPLTAALVPSASWILRSKLPLFAPEADQAAVIATACKAMGSKVRFADLSGALSGHSSEPLYYHTDHHWTSLGAYYGYTALCAALGQVPASLDGFDWQTVTTDFHGSLQAKSGVWWVKPDSIELFSPKDGSTAQVSVEIWESNKIARMLDGLYDREKLMTRNKYSVFLGGNSPLVKIKNPAVHGRKLLMIKDSYAHSLAPFLAAHYSEIDLVDLRYYKADLVDYVKQNGIDEVLVLYSVADFSTDTSVAWLAYQKKR